MQVRLGNEGPWQRLCEHVRGELVGDDFALSFTLRVPAHHTPATPIFFAFSQPFSYQQCQDMLDAVEREHAGASMTCNVATSHVFF